MTPIKGPYTCEKEDNGTAFAFRVVSTFDASKGFGVPVSWRWNIAYVTNGPPDATLEEVEATARLLAKSWEMRRFIERICELGDADDWEAMPQLVNDEGSALLREIDENSQ